MRDYGTVLVNSEEALSVHRVVLEEMGLRNYQSVTENQMWECIRLNATAFVAEMEVLRELNRPNIPDTTHLEALLA